MSEELTLLKERATSMGIAYSPNIGIESLKHKIQAKLDAPANEDDYDAEGALEAVYVKAQSKARSAGNDLQALREQQTTEQLKLVRLRITNLNPSKKDLQGEIFSVANAIVGTVTKFIPYGEVTDNGYHVPFILYTELEDRKFVSIKIRKAPNGQDVVEQRLVPEFALEVLPQLTKDELAKLAAQQAAAAGIE